MLTPLKLDLQHVRGVGRSGRIAGLRVEPGRGLILPGEVEEEKRESQWRWHGQHRRQPRPRRASPIPNVRPPSPNVGPAWHSTGAYRGPGNKGVGGIRQFFPLNLISSFPPTPPQLEAGWLRRSKSGREKRDDGSKRQGGHPHVPAPRPGLFGTDRKN